MGPIGLAIFKGLLQSSLNAINLETVIQDVDFDAVFIRIANINASENIALIALFSS